MSTPTPTVFDEAVVQDDVHQLLREEYEIDELDMVTCPADEAVEEGRTFSCTATIAGEEQDVPITVISDDGEYTVGRPE